MSTLWIKQLKKDDKLLVFDVKYKNKWFLATINAIFDSTDDGITLNIHYDGWSNRWDEMININFKTNIPNRIREYILIIHVHINKQITKINNIDQTDDDIQCIKVSLNSMNFKQIKDEISFAFDSIPRINKLLHDEKYIFTLVDYQYPNKQISNLQQLKPKLPTINAQQSTTFKLRVIFKYVGDKIKWLQTLNINDKVDVDQQYIGSIVGITNNIYNQIESMNIRYNNPNYVSYQRRYELFEEMININCLNESINRLDKVNKYTLAHMYVHWPSLKVCKYSNYGWDGRKCNVCKENCCKDCYVTILDEKWLCCKCFLFRFNRMKMKIIASKYFNEILIDKINDDLIRLILKYSMGVTVECCNIECQNEINLDEYFVFEQWRESLQKLCSANSNYSNHKIDIECKNVYKYITYLNHYNKDNTLVHTILDKDKPFRIFCRNCTANKLKKCSIPSCDNYDVTSQCFQHPICTQCNKIIGKNECDQCVTCKKYYHREYCCRIIQFGDKRVMQCKDCVLTMRNKERIKLISSKTFNYYTNIMEINLIYLIATYSAGFTFTCCNDLTLCRNEINFNENSTFEKYESLLSQETITDSNGNKIYKYKIRAQNVHLSNYQSVSLTFMGLLPKHAQYRMFCAQCTKHGLPICQEDDCRTCDVEKTCLQHIICGVCNELIPKKYANFICKNCDYFYHYKCGIRNTSECKKCVLSLQKQLKRRLLKCKSFNYYFDCLNDKSIDIIINYSIGIVRLCCNAECRKEISFISEKYHYKNAFNGHKVYVYDIPFKKPDFALKTVNIGIKTLRMFCNGCTDSYIYPCKSCNVICDTNDLCYFCYL